MKRTQKNGRSRKKRKILVERKIEKRKKEMKSKNAGLKPLEQAKTLPSRKKIKVSDAGLKPFLIALYPSSRRKR